MANGPERRDSAFPEPPTRSPEQPYSGQTTQTPQSAQAPQPAQAPRPPPEPRTLERLIPELIKRGLEVGKFRLENVSESIFPKEIAASMISQLDDARQGIVTAVAQEVGRFLRQADIAAEVRKVLVGLNIEANLQIKFKQNNEGNLEPEVEVRTGAKRRAHAKAQKSGSEPPPST